MGKVKDLLTLLKLSGFRKAYRNSIVLRSMQKSGTNYLRLILANYFYNLNRDSFQPVDYDKMHHELFPNVRSKVFEGEGYRTAGETVKAEKGKDYSDFMYDHGSILDGHFLKRIASPRKMIFLYRNPLDLLVSRFYYYYKNNPEDRSGYDHPRDIIESNLPLFIRDYRLMKDYTDSNSNAMMVSYEDLKSSPEETVEGILSFLDIELKPELLRQSIDASSVKKVKETEKKRGGAIHTPPAGLKGSFVRSGAIGEWEEYFDENEVSKITSKLNSSGIELNEFTLQTDNP